MDRVRIIRVAAGEDGGAWAAALGEAAWERGAAVLKDDLVAGVTVWRARLLGREVVVKRWEFNSLKARLEALVGWTRGLRHWRGAEKLMAIRVRTAEPYALVRGRGREWLVMEHLPGKSVLQHLADRDLSVRDEHALARELGRQAAHMAVEGVFNRDHKPSNLIAVRTGATPQVAVIDCVAISGPREPWRMGVAFLAEPIGCGVPPRRTLKVACLRAAVREAVRAEFLLPKDEERVLRGAAKVITAGLSSHGDPTPLVNPLSDQTRPERR